MHWGQGVSPKLFANLDQLCLIISAKNTQKTFFPKKNILFRLFAFQNGISFSHLASLNKKDENHLKRATSKHNTKNKHHRHHSFKLTKMVWLFQNKIFIFLEVFQSDKNLRESDFVSNQTGFWGRIFWLGPWTKKSIIHLALNMNACAGAGFQNLSYVLGRKLCYDQDLSLSGNGALAMHRSIPLKGILLF